MRDRAALLCLGITAGSLALGSIVAMLVGGTYRAPDGLTALAVGGLALMLLGAMDRLHERWSRLTTQQSLLSIAHDAHGAEFVCLLAISVYASLLMLFDPFLFPSASYEEAILVVLSFVPFVAVIRLLTGRQRALPVVGASVFITAYIAILKSGSWYSDAGRGFFHYWRS